MDNILLIDTNVYVTEPVTVISKLALLNRMTVQEFAGVLAAAKADTEVEVWKIKFDLATKFNMADQKTRDDINFLVSKNLLNQERAEQILTAPIQDSERP